MSLLLVLVVLFGWLALWLFVAYTLVFITHAIVFIVTRVAHLARRPYEPLHRSDVSESA